MSYSKKLHAVSIVVAVLLLTTAMTIDAKPAAADDARDAQQLVDKARLTFDSFLADKHMGDALRALVKKAKGILVYPQVLRGAFIVGVSGGSGVMLARDQMGDNWAGPAFYTMGEASFGLQAGGQASEVVLVALTDRGVAALLSTSTKLGGDVGVAVGPVGAGAEAATANLSADILSYSRAKGLYAGVSLEGAVVAARNDLNRAYYGKKVTPTDILVHRAVANQQAAGLIEAVAKAAGGSRTVQRTPSSSGQ
jgi:lipid-binding SYLF domain-containing protein